MTELGFPGSLVVAENLGDIKVPDMCDLCTAFEVEWECVNCQMRYCKYCIEEYYDQRICDLCGYGVQRIEWGDDE